MSLHLVLSPFLRISTMEGLSRPLMLSLKKLFAEQSKLSQASQRSLFRRSGTAIRGRRCDGESSRGCPRVLRHEKGDWQVREGVK